MTDGGRVKHFTANAAISINYKFDIEHDVWRMNTMTEKNKLQWWFYKLLLGHKHLFISI